MSNSALIQGGWIKVEKLKENNTEGRDSTYYR